MVLLSKLNSTVLQVGYFCVHGEAHTQHTLPSKAFQQMLLQFLLYSRQIFCFVSFCFFSFLIQRQLALITPPVVFPSFSFSSFSFSDGEGKKRASNICSSESLNAVGATLTPRRISWRQRIFLRVASPMNKSASKMQHPGWCVLSSSCCRIVSTTVSCCM